ncbi:MAG: WecB/TagA/CpsF family glycosyltransferase [Rhodocyclales bacterium]|nr:WecB/TagA/CpsF family glycosyltransferase [Rhodocyclales bacterium]
MFDKFISERNGPDGGRRRFFNFCGIDIEALTYEEMDHRIDRWISDKSGRSHHIACLNAYCISLSLRDERLKAIYQHSDIAGPDGMPFVRLMRYAMQAHCDRFDAPDIVLHLARRSIEKGYTFYLYGGAPDVLDSMRSYLNTAFPHLRIVGARSPPFRTLTDEEDQAVCDEINRLQPDIILAGLGTPKQDYWIDAHLERLRGSVIIASGATFDFFGGRVAMAPQWIRESGFEWLHRLISKDFLRLWKRYTYHNALFAYEFLGQLARARKSR